MKTKRLIIRHQPNKVLQIESELNVTPKTPPKDPKVVSIVEEKVMPDDSSMTSSFHRKDISMPSYKSEISLSMPGSQDGIHSQDMVKNAPPRT